MFCGEFLGMKEFIATQGWVYFRLRNLQKTFIFDANNFEFAKNSFLPLKSCRFWTFGSLWKLCEIKGGSDFASENVKILQFRCNNFESRTDCRFRTFESLRNWMNSKGVWFRFKKLPKILHFWYTKFCVSKSLLSTLEIVSLLWGYESLRKLCELMKMSF